MELREAGKTGVKLFPLGFGMMRLPNKDGSQGEALTPKDAVDVDRSIAMLRNAIDNGVNYVDTAFNYIGGMSEKITGMALQDGYREKVYLATKSPTWMYKEPGDFDSFLNKQLERLKTDYIDFYCLHSINGGAWKRVLRIGAIDSLIRAKEEGRCKYIGFSFHDDLDLFKECLDAAPWDYVQIQLNYHDIDYQAGVEGAKLAAERGLAVIVMEPLRGGYLANVPPKVADVFNATGIDRTPVEWAFDFLWDMPEVSVVLSGMGNEQEIADNIEYAKRAKVGMLTDEEREVYVKAKEVFDSISVIPCTGCNYCVEYCPSHLAIPYNFIAYNTNFIYEDLDMAKAYYASEVTKFGGRADKCVSCGVCEEHCPQRIEISEWMPKVHELLGE